MPEMFFITALLAQVAFIALVAYVALVVVLLLLGYKGLKPNYQFFGSNRAPLAVASTPLFFMMANDKVVHEPQLAMVCFMSGCVAALLWFWFWWRSHLHHS